MKPSLPTFWKYVITVLGGALGAQALPLLAAPLITRMCSPADMDAFRLWLAVVAVAAVGATLRYTFRVLLLGLLPSLTLLLFSPQLFAWVFGPAWREAGELAQILASLYFLNLIVSRLSYVFFMSGRQNVDMGWQITLFVMTLGVFVMPGALHDNVLRYALGYLTLYFVYLHMSWQCSQNRMAAA